MPTPYVIDFNGLTMNTTVTNDKLVGNVMEEVKNVDLNVQGRFRKREALSQVGDTTFPDSATVYGIAPYTRTTRQGTNLETVAIVGNKMWRTTTLGNAWTQVGSDLAGGSPTSEFARYNYTWGQDSSGNPTLYFGSRDVDMFRYDDTPQYTVLGSGTFDAAHAVEYYLKKLFVANTIESGTNFDNRIRWTVTGDDDDWTGVGSGFLDLPMESAGDSLYDLGIKALKVYRNRLYIGTDNSLFRLTGTTSATFGSEYIRDADYIAGPSMWVLGDYLYWVDRSGLWEFNGVQAVNVTKRDMDQTWSGLNRNAIEEVTATVDIWHHRYIFLIPDENIIFIYYPLTRQWSEVTVDTSVLPSMDTVGSSVNMTNNSTVGEGPMFYIGDGQASSRIFLNGYTSNKGSDDNNGTTAAVAASFKTGHIRLGEQGGGIGAQFRIEGIDIETVQQDEAGVVKIQMTIDGTAGTQETLTVGDAGASADTFPTIYNGRDGNTQIDLTDLGLTGHTFQMEVTDDDANSRCDIRRIIVWYEPLPGKQDA